MSPVKLTDGRVGGGEGEEAKSYDDEKPGSSINHLIFSAINNLKLRSCGNFFFQFEKYFGRVIKFIM